MKVEAQKEHQWLQKLVGEWTYESEMPTEAGPVKHTGTESVRSLGGIWIMGESNGQVPGGDTATSVITLGYDSQKKRYVGTWIGTMMTNLWVYDGELDASGRVLTLHSEGPSMTGDGTTAQYKDVIAFEGNDHRTLTGHVQTKDGKWQAMMTVSYRRKK